MNLNPQELAFLSAWAREEKAVDPYVLPAHRLQAAHKFRGVTLIRAIKAWARTTGRRDEDIFSLSDNPNPAWPWSSDEEMTMRLAEIAQHSAQVYLFVEGPTDAVFLRRVLPEEVLKDAELVIGGGEDGIPSLARTLLVRRRKPIAVLIDSDSLAADVIEERRQSLEELIRAANASIPVKVVAAVPEIESWFFAAPEAIERVLGEKVSPELVFLGKRDPQGVLQQLAGHSKKPWDTNQAIGLLDARDIERIRAIPEVLELTTFLQKMQQGGQAA